MSVSNWDSDRLLVLLASWLNPNAIDFLGSKVMALCPTCQLSFRKPDKPLAGFQTEAHSRNRNETKFV